MLSNSIEVSLHSEIILKFGLTSSKMIELYSLWLHYFCILICDPAKSSTKGDTINPFCTEVDNITNFYSIGCRISSSYSHKFEFVSTTGLDNSDSVVIWYLVLG